MKTVTYYKFRDLSEEARKRAIREFQKAILNTHGYWISDKNARISITKCGYSFKKSGNLWCR